MGILLRDAHLFCQRPQGMTALTAWSVTTEGSNQLRIETAQPRSTWVFDLQTNVLRISTTEPNGVLVAQVPAPPDRAVVRLMDDRGTPVELVGNGEVVATYGGTNTRKLSFLPQKNAETMFFSLGQISGANFHSLFDRKTDTAIDFEPGTELRREKNDRDTLDVTLPVHGNTHIRALPDYYTKTLGMPFYVKFDDRYFPSAPMVWSSWTSYYEAVTEQDIVRNADWLATHLRPYGFQYVQLDDGYDRGKQGEHYWIENWDRTKFPHGPEWLTGYIRSRGLKAGIWLVPNAYAGAVKLHPDWYLHTKQGKVLLDYNTPALDSTNPHALELVKHIFTTLDDWGFEYYKFDGEQALPQYAPPVDRSRLYDPSANFVANYRDRLKMIRDTIGPRRFIEACPTGTPLNGIGYVDSYFNGQDLYNNWQGMYALFSGINANAFLNHFLVYVMPGEGLALDPKMTVEEAKKTRSAVVIETEKEREYPMTGFGTSLAEARTLVSYIALTGVVYPLASVMPDLPPERVKLLQATMPTLPIFPIDLFSRGTDSTWDTFKHVRPDDYIHNYPEYLDLKVDAPSGIYDVVGITNWRSWPTSRTVAFHSRLGLDPDRQYVVFDFWNKKVLGTFTQELTVDIPPHDTRVLLIHPMLDRPQILGSSRHITGAYSLLAQQWNGSTHVLSGSSRTVKGHSYSVWIYLPKQIAVQSLQARIKGGGLIPIHHTMDDRTLVFSFPGQKNVVDWTIQFAPLSSKN